MEVNSKKYASSFILPWWHLIIGLFVLLGSSFYVFRILREQTVLSWERGPQMVGFSLMHGEFFFLAFFPILLLLWLLVVVINSIYKIIKRYRISIITWIMLSYAIVLFILLFLPYEFWQRLFINKYSKEHSIEFFISAAANGDLKTLQAFQSNGVMVNDFNKDGTTALHAAVMNGHNEIVLYLLSQGGNPNLVNRYGNTPLDNAKKMKKQSTVEILLKPESKSKQ